MAITTRKTSAAGVVNKDAPLTNEEMDQNFIELVQGKSDVGHDHEIADVNGLQSALDGKAASSHPHTIANVTGLQAALDGKAAASHGHDWGDISGKPTTATRWPSWSEVSSKPTSFTPASHTHPVSQITGLGTAATKDVGTDDGNVMEVGAFGIGKVLNYNPDITLEAQHIDGLGSASHGNRVPIDGPDPYIGKVLYIGNATWGTQLWFSYNEGKAWFRNKETGKPYEPWKEFIHTGNIRTSLGYSIYPVSQKLVTEQLAAKANSSHTHPWAQVTGQPATATRWPTWEEVSEKPSTFAPSSHTHSWSQITGAPSTATRWPSWSEVTSKPSLVETSRTITAGTGLTGGGSLAANITISLDSTSQTHLSRGNTAYGWGNHAGKYWDKNIISGMEGDESITEYPSDISIQYNGGSSFSSGYGVVVTFNSSIHRNFQLFAPKDTGDLYIRQWHSTNNNWLDNKIWHSGNSDSFSATGNYASLRARGTTKADVGLSGIPNTNGSTSNFLRGDGTWATPPNTTYSVISTAEIDAGTASTARTISAARLKYITDKLTPSSRTITAGTGLTGGGNLSANRTLSVNFGTSAGTVTQGNDSRLSNAREWTASTVSQAEAEAGTSTTRRAWTAQRVRQAVLAHSNALGIGQTWQNVSSSRNSGVYYTNTTGKPIAVSVQGDGATVGVWVGLTLKSQMRGEDYAFFIVPNGRQYMVQCDNIANWVELR